MKADKSGDEPSVVIVPSKYVIPFIPPSNNKFKGRQNPWEYRTLKKEWEKIVAVYCRPKPSFPMQRCTVTINYYFKTKARHDPDNYNGVFLLDGLVKCGILQDDSFDCIDLVLRGGYDKINPRTEVELSQTID